MHCAGCVNSVEKALSNISEIESVSVQLTTETAVIETSGDSFPAEKVKDAIEKAGYELDEPFGDSVTFDVSGMTCTGCSSAVEKSLKRKGGVISATVNLAAEKAYVKFDTSQTTIKDLEEAIRDAGYEVTGQKKSPQIS